MSKEDAFFAKVADEIAAGQLDRALWTKAFAQADGEENRAKATYIRLRAAQLQEQEANRPDKFLPEGLAFTDSNLSYKGKTIPYAQVTGVTFYSVEKSVNGIPKEDSHTITFRSSRETIELKRTTYFKIRNGNRKREFEAVHTFANHYIFPGLVAKLVQPVLERDQTLYLGGLTIKQAGLAITMQGWFGSQNNKTLDWSRYYSTGFGSGAARIWEKADSKKGYAEWGAISMQIENAIMLPQIINTVFQRRKR